MTTIAYRSGVVAYDSRLTSDNLICDDHDNKHFTRNGVHFFVAGTFSQVERFINSYFEEEDLEGCDVIAFVIDGNKVYECQTYEGKFHKTPIRFDCAASIGSGSAFALTAMDLGKSPREAVKQASKRDCKTGGTIREYRIKDGTKSRKNPRN